MSTEIIEMPLKWSEKLERLEVGYSEPVDNRDAARTAVNRFYKKYPKTKKKFSIRPIKETGEVRLWRIK